MLIYAVGGVAGTRGPFFKRCRAPRTAIPFSQVGARRCRPTVLRNVGRRGTRVSTVVLGPRGTGFGGAVRTFRRSNRLLSEIISIFNGVLDTRAGSSLRRLTRGVVPLLDRRDGGVALGRGLFTHIGRICSRGRALRLARRRDRLLRGTCGDFMQRNTGLRKRTERRCHGLAARLDGLALSFDRGGLGRAGDCRVLLAGGRDLTKLPRVVMRTTTRATGDRKGRN